MKKQMYAYINVQVNILNWCFHQKSIALYVKEKMYMKCQTLDRENKKKMSVCNKLNMSRVF